MYELITILYHDEFHRLSLMHMYWRIIESHNSNCQLIDVRDEYEHDICCIGGEKINMYSITDNIDKLSKNKKIIVYCRTGVRSANIVNLLEKSFSFDNVYNLDDTCMGFERKFSRNRAMNKFKLKQKTVRKKDKKYIKNFTTK